MHAQQFEKNDYASLPLTGLAYSYEVQREQPSWVNMNYRFIDKNIS